ncbi:hypothetical protein M408DRAFT_325833 [Serendipita vermifera MAFF 305830]|uniref:Uncharacterized protein n=1 Tax=Serendipita vermifera MAFF 305830 TaxID=933852 RepID=A0A0C3BSQ9_SERVB|nr:hypothetical protein M408DRAFT_325833 [Serendipita vermifera MAFF 305830]
MSASGWETIRPWTNRVAIQVKELTSISATFILSSATAADATDGELAALHSAEPIPQRLQKSVGEILSHGFTIKVNGGSWNNSFLNVEEDGSEAVIILHGLRPGRRYEVELTLEQEESALKKDFATLENDLFAQQMSFDQIQAPEENINDLSPLSPEVVPSRELTPPITPESASPPQSITAEEKAAYLRLRKLSFDAQIKDLDSQLKLERKESQRAENATRAEIETLKKASEKQTVADQRAKQKILALQEAVKQTLSATGDIEAQAVATQAELPELQKKESAIEADHATVMEAAKQKDAEVEQALRSDKKRTSDLQSELTTLSNRVEKLTSKRDKLVNETVPELEQQLADIRKEIEEAEFEKEQFSHYSISDDPLLSPLAGFRNPIHSVPNARIPAPRRSAPFAGSQPFSQINAAAPPFYPNRQPGIIHRLPGARPPNEFRPFDPALPQMDAVGSGSFPHVHPPRRTSMDGQ